MYILVYAYKGNQNTARELFLFLRKIGQTHSTQSTIIQLDHFSIFSHK